MDIKQLEADFQNYIDSCNKLRNSVSAIWKTEMLEDVDTANIFSKEYTVARARYLGNLGNIGTGIRAIRDGFTTKSIRISIQEIKEHLSVTAK